MTKARGRLFQKERERQELEHDFMDEKEVKESERFQNRERERKSEEGRE